MQISHKLEAFKKMQISIAYYHGYYFNDTPVAMYTGAS